MNDILCDQQEALLFITFNRIHKHNAFDDQFLHTLQTILDEAAAEDSVHALILKANGKHFCAGADLSWMQRMMDYSEQENIDDAMVLAKLMHSIHNHPKPTIAMVHGHAMGGGAGLVAACDIAIAAHTAHFCFSEVKLGLIPAVISPYIVKAMGERRALELFLSAELFDAQRAYELALVHHVVPADKLLAHTVDYAKHIAAHPRTAITATKHLVRAISGQCIDDKIQKLCAKRIAKQRVSLEAQQKMRDFLSKRNQDS